MSGSVVLRRWLLKTVSSTLTRSRLEHVVTMIVLLLFITVPAVYNWKYVDYAVFNKRKNNPMIIVYLVYFSRIFTCFGFPFTCLNFIGLIWMNASRRAICLKNSHVTPFLCFRVVTRGLFPELVKENVQRNLNTCYKAGLTNFMFEVVTDRAVNLERRHVTREVVVPSEYQTLKGTKYKAKALHFCNEPTINRLRPNDWIVHLDEETLLTHEALYGIHNFTSDGKFDFGQGVITYASGDVVNWITTLMDSVRVAVDYGYLKFALSTLHEPILNWKGSFMVARVAAEHDVSFDHGLEGSIAEDCFFGAVAAMKGYRFNFIEGDMLEQSPFTFGDFIKQRKRWNQGLYLVSRSTNIAWRNKLGITFLVISAFTLPIVSLGTIVTFLLDIPMSGVVRLLFDFLLGCFAFLFVFGTYKSLERHRCSSFKKCMLVVLSICVLPVSVVVENIASISSWSGLNDIRFYVVHKDCQKRLNYLQ